jgi:hypothetical protein
MVHRQVADVSSCQIRQSIRPGNSSDYVSDGQAHEAHGAIRTALPLSSNARGAFILFCFAAGVDVLLNRAVVYSTVVRYPTSRTNHLRTGLSSVKVRLAHGVGRRS